MRCLAIPLLVPLMLAQLSCSDRARARTTGAPVQHWFGPSGDVRAGGIHTKHAIQLCWSSHREVIYDYGPTSQIPPQS
eukprot:g28403.t1